MFTLIYTFMIVEVTGRDLYAVAHAISARKCDCIRELEKKQYDPPASGKPIMESITIPSADEKLTAAQR